MHIRRFIQLFGTLLLALASQTAWSAAATGTFTVTATVNAACSVTTNNVAFGTYNPAAAATASGAVNVTCTSGTTYTIALDAGAHAGTATNFSGRQMASGANNLPYQLYLDSGLGTVWGDGTAGSSVNPNGSSFIGNGSAQSATVYGEIAAGHYVPTGSYSDTVNVTVTY